MAPKQQYTEVDIFSDDFLVVSSAIPEGDHALFFTWELNKGNDGKSEERIGMRVTAYSLATAEKKEKFLSLGKGALRYFRPMPENNKKLVLLPAAEKDSARKSANANTSFGIFWNSLKNAGLPPDISAQDLSYLDGLWASIGTEAEPAEWAQARKGGNAAAKGLVGGGAAKEEERAYTPGVIPIVTAILDGGAPWEGGGGMPEGAEAPAAPAKPAAATKGKPGAKPKPAPVAEVSTDDLDIEEVAQEAIGDAISTLGDGTVTVKIKNHAFEYIKTNYSEDAAAMFMEQVSNDDEAFKLVLTSLGKKIGPMKKVIAA